MNEVFCGYCGKKDCSFCHSPKQSNTGVSEENIHKAIQDANKDQKEMVEKSKQSMEKETWEKDFDKKYPQDELEPELQIHINKCKDFIRQTLSSQKEKMLGVLEGMVVEHVDTSDSSKWGETYTIDERMRTTTYNKAIYDVKKKIGEL